MKKNVTYVTLWGAYLFSKVHICDAKIAHLDDIANLESLPYGLHFSEVISFTVNPLYNDHVRSKPSLTLK